MFLVDARRRLTLTQSMFLPPNGNPYLGFGTAVKTGSAFGTISDVRVKRDGDAALEPYQPICVVSNGGIHLVQDGARWVLEGTYAPSVPTTYEHCRDVFARHRTLATKTS